MVWCSRRRAEVASCPECGHRWDDHAGGSALSVAASDPGARELCEECGYEVAHGQRDPALGECRLRAHHSRVQVLLGRTRDALAAVGPVEWDPPRDDWQTARVGVDLPDGLSAVLFEDQDTVQVCFDERTQLRLTDAEERRLPLEPEALFADLMTRVGHPMSTARIRVARLLQAHEAARFPSRLRGEEVHGVDVVTLDADVVGCTSTWLASGERLDAEGLAVLRRSRDDAARVLPHLDRPAEAACVTRLRALAVAVLGAAG